MNIFSSIISHNTYFYGRHICNKKNFYLIDYFAMTRKKKLTEMYGKVNIVTRAPNF